MIQYFKEILKGILIGIANIIPGVSGGTMAVSMGIYDKIISAVTNIFKNFKKSFLTLLPYLIGLLVGIGGLSFIMDKLFTSFPLQTSAAFIGLILGGLPILWSHVKGKKLEVSNILVFIVFFALIIGLQLLGETTGTEVVLNVSIVQVILLFIVGVIASATMVIPGVSGSMILMLIGYYQPVIKTVKEFIEALVSLNGAGILRGIGILLPFGLGVLVGIFAIAKLIEILLNKFETLTYSGILGLVIASPFAIMLGTAIPSLGIGVILGSIVTFSAGFFLAYYLGRNKA